MRRQRADDRRGARVGEVVVAEVEVLEGEAAVVARPQKRAREAFGLLALPAELDVVEREVLLLERRDEPLLVVGSTMVDRSVPLVNLMLASFTPPSSSR